MNLRDGSVEDLSRDGWKARLREYFDPNQIEGEPPKWAVVTVKIDTNRLADSDRWLQKRMIRVKDAETAGKWLEDGAILRVLVCRRRALGRAWNSMGGAVPRNKPR